MTDMVSLILAIAAGSTLVFGTIAVWILMGYYSARIFRSFRGGVLMKGWRYICIAVPFLILGQLATGLSDSSGASAAQDLMFRALGLSMSLVGGVLIVIGFRTEYRAWNPKKMNIPSTEGSIPHEAMSQAVGEV